MKNKYFILLTFLLSSIFVYSNDIFPPLDENTAVITNEISTLDTKIIELKIIELPIIQQQIINFIYNSVSYISFDNNNHDILIDSNIIKVINIIDGNTLIFEKIKKWEDYKASKLGTHFYEPNTATVLGCYYNHIMDLQTKFGLTPEIKQKWEDFFTKFGVK